MSVLLIESEIGRLAHLSAALRAAGISVIAVQGIADVERWPVGELVVTEADNFTPWWMLVGALGVIVLADTPEQGCDACKCGATAWIPRVCHPSELIVAIRDLDVNAPTS